MKIDLKSKSKKELLKLKADVDKALARVEARDLKAAREAAEKAVAALGFSLDDIAGAPAKGKAKRKANGKANGKKSPPKFADPADPKKTWTGRGRQPEWFKSAIAAGKPAESMAIK